MYKTDKNLIELRQYPADGPRIIVLHGGPGAPGYMAPVACRLSQDFYVIEPFQRKGDPAEPLTVARHVADLQDVIESTCPNEKPVLVGHSWGAMLALAYAAVYPDRTAGLVLIGCGTFDPVSRERMKAIRNERMTQHVFKRLHERIEAAPDTDERLRLQGKLMMQVDSHALIHVENEVVYFDGLGHEQTWQDMMRLQSEGVYPQAFKAIKTQVLMLHGTEDPHPGQMIRETLKVCLPQLEYHQWSQCGHYPWLEKAAGADFYAFLTEQLKRMTSL